MAKDSHSEMDEALTLLELEQALMSTTNGKSGLDDSLSSTKSSGPPLDAGAVLGTGEPRQHFFMTRGGRHEHLNFCFKSSGPRSGFLLSIITVWGIGKLAPPAAAGAPACQMN